MRKPSPQDIKEWKSDILSKLNNDAFIVTREGRRLLSSMLDSGVKSGFADVQFGQEIRDAAAKRLAEIQNTQLIDPATGQPAMKQVQRRGYQPQIVPQTGKDLFMGGEFFGNLGSAAVGGQRGAIISDLEQQKAAEAARFQEIVNLLAPKTPAGMLRNAGARVSGFAQGAIQGLQTQGFLGAPPSPEELATTMLQVPTDEITAENALTEVGKEAGAGGVAFGQQIAPTVFGGALARAAAPTAALLGLGKKSWGMAGLAGLSALYSYTGAQLTNKAVEQNMRRIYGDDVYENEIMPILGTAKKESPEWALGGSLSAIPLQGLPKFTSGIGVARSADLFKGAMRGTPVALAGTSKELGENAMTIAAAQAAGMKLPQIAGAENKFAELTSAFLQRFSRNTNQVADKFKVFAPTGTRGERFQQLGKFMASTPGGQEFISDLIGEQAANIGLGAFDYLNQLRAYQNDPANNAPPDTMEALANFALGSIFIGDTKLQNAMAGLGAGIGRATLAGASKVPGLSTGVEALQKRYIEGNQDFIKAMIESDVQNAMSSQKGYSYADLIGTRSRLGGEAKFGSGPRNIAPTEVPIVMPNGQVAVFDPDAESVRLEEFGNIFNSVDDTEAVNLGRSLNAAFEAMPTMRTGRGLGKLKQLGGRDIRIPQGDTNQTVEGVVADSGGNAWAIVRETPVTETGERMPIVQTSILRVQDLEGQNQQIASDILSAANLNPATTVYQSDPNQPTQGVPSLNQVMLNQRIIEAALPDKQLKDLKRQFPTLVQFDQETVLRGRVLGQMPNGELSFQAMNYDYTQLRVNPVNIVSGKQGLSTVIPQVDAVSLQDFMGDVALRDMYRAKFAEPVDVFTTPNTGIHTLTIGKEDFEVALTPEQQGRLLKVIENYQKRVQVANENFEGRQLETALAKSKKAAETELFGDLPTTDVGYRPGTTLVANTSRGQFTGVVVDNTPYGPMVAFQNNDWKPVLVQPSSIVDAQEPVPLADLAAIEAEDNPLYDRKQQNELRRRMEELLGIKPSRKKEKTPGQQKIDFDKTGGVPPVTPSQETSGKKTEKATDIDDVQRQAMAFLGRETTEEQALAFSGLLPGGVIIDADGNSYPLVVEVVDAKGIKSNRNITHVILSKVWSGNIGLLSDYERFIMHVLGMPDPEDPNSKEWWRNAYQGVSILNSSAISSAVTAASNLFVGMDGSIDLDGLFQPDDPNVEVVVTPRPDSFKVPDQPEDQPEDERLLDEFFDAPKTGESKPKDQAKQAPPKEPPVPPKTKPDTGTARKNLRGWINALHAAEPEAGFDQLLQELPTIAFPEDFKAALDELGVDFPVFLMPLSKLTQEQKEIHRERLISLASNPDLGFMLKQLVFRRPGGSLLNAFRIYRKLLPSQTPTSDISALRGEELDTLPEYLPFVRHFRWRHQTEPQGWGETDLDKQLQHHAVAQLALETAFLSTATYEGLLEFANPADSKSRNKTIQTLLANLDKDLTEKQAEKLIEQFKALKSDVDTLRQIINNISVPYSLPIFDADTDIGAKIVDNWAGKEGKYPLLEFTKEEQISIAQNGIPFKAIDPTMLAFGDKPFLSILVKDLIMAKPDYDWFKPLPFDTYVMHGGKKYANFFVSLDAMSQAKIFDEIFKRSPTDGQELQDRIDKINRFVDIKKQFDEFIARQQQAIIDKGAATQEIAVDEEPGKPKDQPSVPTRQGMNLSGFIRLAKDTPENKPKDEAKGMLPLSLSEIGDIKRFDIGKKLSKEEKAQVLESLYDSYLVKGAPLVIKGYDKDGEEIYGLEQDEKWMEKSSITSRAIRYVIEIPVKEDTGLRSQSNPDQFVILAHPSELFPEYTDKKIIDKLQSLLRKRILEQRILVDDIIELVKMMTSTGDANFGVLDEQPAEWVSNIREVAQILGFPLVKNTDLLNARAKLNKANSLLDYATNGYTHELAVREAEVLTANFLDNWAKSVDLAFENRVKETIPVDKETRPEYRGFRAIAQEFLEGESIYYDYKKDAGWELAKFDNETIQSGYIPETKLGFLILRATAAWDMSTRKAEDLNLGRKYDSINAGIAEAVFLYKRWLDTEWKGESGKPEQINFNQTSRQEIDQWAFKIFNQMIELKPESWKRFRLGTIDEEGIITVLDPVLDVDVPIDFSDDDEPSKTNPLGGTVATIPTSTIFADPQRLQYKIAGSLTKSGETGSVREAKKWNPELGGVLSVWVDPVDGKTYVVNGHNRLGLAKRFKVDSVNVLYLDAKDASEARLKGALQNIAEGNGTAIDAAKIMRETQLGEEAMAMAGIQLSNAIMIKAVPISKLTPYLFDELIKENMTELMGATLGASGLPEAVLHDLYKTAKKKKWSADKVEYAVGIARTSTVTTGQADGQTVLGADDEDWGQIFESSDFEARLNVQQAIGSNLREEMRALGIAANQRRVAILERAGSNINVAQSMTEAQTAKTALELFMRLANYQGPIQDLIQDLVRQVKAGKAPNAVVRANLDRIKTEINSVIGTDNFTRATTEQAEDTPISLFGEFSAGNFQAEGIAEEDAPPAQEDNDGMALFSQRQVQMAGRKQRIASAKRIYEDALPRVLAGKPKDTKGVDAILMRDLAAVGRYLIEKSPDPIGFEEWSGDMLDLVGVEYQPYLENAWNEASNLDVALKPKTSVMTLFSGGGIFEQGILNRHAKVVAAVEIDPKIASHYKSVYGKHVIEKPVQDVDYRVYEGRVDHLHASPVCVGFCNIRGARPVMNIDMEMAMATARAIREIKPKSVSIENAVRYQNTAELEQITKALDQGGYKYDIQNYNASDFGTPQNRRRMILRAWKLDAPLPPVQKTHSPKQNQTQYSWLDAVKDVLPQGETSRIPNWQLQRLGIESPDQLSLTGPMLVEPTTGGPRAPKLFAANEIVSALRTGSGGRVARVLIPEKGGVKTVALPMRGIARLMGLSDNYPLPDNQTLAQTVIGNGVTPQIAAAVVGPMLDAIAVNAEPLAIESEPTGLFSASAKFVAPDDDSDGIADVDATSAPGLTENQKALLRAGGFVLADGKLDKKGIIAYATSLKNFKRGSIKYSESGPSYQQIKKATEAVVELREGSQTFSFTAMQSTDKANFAYNLKRLYSQTKEGQADPNSVEAKADSIADFFDTMAHAAASRRLRLMEEAARLGYFSARYRGGGLISGTRDELSNLSYDDFVARDLAPLHKRFRELVDAPKNASSADLFASENPEIVKKVARAMAIIAEEETMRFYTERMPAFAHFDVIPEITEVVGDTLIEKEGRVTSVYDPSTGQAIRVLMAFHAAEIDTMVHEIAHGYFEALPYALKRDISSSLGHQLRNPTITNPSVITYEAHEKFAYGLVMRLANVRKPKDWSGATISNPASQKLYKVLDDVAAVVRTSFSFISASDRKLESSVGIEDEKFFEDWKIQYTFTDGETGKLAVRSDLYLWKGAPVILHDGTYATVLQDFGLSGNPRHKVWVRKQGAFDNEQIKIKEIAFIGGKTFGIPKSTMQILSKWIGESRGRLGIEQSTPEGRRTSLIVDDNGQVVDVKSRITNVNAVTNRNVRSFAVNLGLPYLTDPAIKVIRDAMEVDRREDAIQKMLRKQITLQREYSSGHEKLFSNNPDIRKFGFFATVGRVVERLMDVSAPNRSTREQRDKATAALNAYKDNLNNNAGRNVNNAIYHAAHAAYANRYISDSVNEEVKRISGIHKRPSRWSLVMDSNGMPRVDKANKNVYIQEIVRKGRKYIIREYKVNLRSGQAFLLQEGNVDTAMSEIMDRIAEMEDEDGYLEGEDIEGLDGFGPIVEEIPMDFEIPGVTYSEINGVPSSFSDTMAEDLNDRLSKALYSIGLLKDPSHKNSTLRVMSPHYFIAKALARQYSGKRDIQGIRSELQDNRDTQSGYDSINARTSELSDEMAMLGFRRPALVSVLNVSDPDLVAPNQEQQAALKQDLSVADDGVGLYSIAIANDNYQKAVTEGDDVFIDTARNGVDGLFQNAVSNFAKGNLNAFNRQMQYLGLVASDNIDVAVSGFESKSFASIAPSIASGDAKPHLIGNVEVSKINNLAALGRAAFLGKSLAQPNIFVTEPTDTEDFGFYEQGYAVVPAIDLTFNESIDPMEFRSFADANPEIINGLQVSEDGKKASVFMVPASQISRAESSEWTKRTTDAIESFFNADPAAQAAPFSSLQQRRFRLWNLGSSEFGGIGTFAEYERILDVVQAFAKDDGIPTDGQKIAAENRRLKSAVQTALSTLFGKPMELSSKINFRRASMPTNIHKLMSIHWEDMPVNAWDKDPYVSKAYLALTKELGRQFKNMNLTLDFMPVKMVNGKPISSESGMQLYVDMYERDRLKPASDIRTNRHLYIKRATASSFGANISGMEKHPLWGNSPFKTGQGETLKWIDVLNGIQDAINHSLYDANFGVDGNNLGYVTHAMLTQDPWAIWALANQTQLPNAYINFNMDRVDVAGIVNFKNKWNGEFILQKGALPAFENLYTGLNQIDDRLRAFSSVLRKDFDGYNGTIDHLSSTRAQFGGTGNAISALGTSIVGLHNPKLEEAVIDLKNFTIEGNFGNNPHSYIDNLTIMPSATPTQQQALNAILNDDTVELQSVGRTVLKSVKAAAHILNDVAKAGAAGDASPILTQLFILNVDDPRRVGVQLNKLVDTVFNPNLGIEVRGKLYNREGMMGRKMFHQSLDDAVRSRPTYQHARHLGLILSSVQADNQLEELRKTNPAATLMDVNELGMNNDAAMHNQIMQHFPGVGPSERFYSLSKDITKMNFFDIQIRNLIDLGYNPTPLLDPLQPFDPATGKPNIVNSRFNRAVRNLASLTNIISGDIRMADNDEIDKILAENAKLAIFSPRWWTSRFMLERFGRTIWKNGLSLIGQGAKADEILRLNGMSDEQMKVGLADLRNRDPYVGQLHTRLMWQAWLALIGLIAALYSTRLLNPRTMAVSVDNYGTRLRIGDYVLRAPGAISNTLETIAAFGSGILEWNERRGTPDEDGLLSVVGQKVFSSLLMKASPLASTIYETVTGRDIFGRPSNVKDEAATVFGNDLILPLAEQMGFRGLTERNPDGTLKYSTPEMNKAFMQRMMWWWLHDLMDNYYTQRLTGQHKGEALTSALLTGAFSYVGGRVIYAPEELNWQLKAAKNFEGPSLITAFQGKYSPYEILAGAEARMKGDPFNPDMPVVDPFAAAPLEPLIGSTGPLSLDNQGDYAPTFYDEQLDLEEEPSYE